MDEGKRWTRYLFLGRRLKTFSNTLHQRRFAGSEIASQQDKLWWRQQIAE